MNAATKVTKHDAAITLQLAEDHRQHMTAILAAPDAVARVADLHARLAALGWEPQTAAAAWHAVHTGRGPVDQGAAYAWIRCVALASPWRPADTLL